jgi:excisionase family DNA binding protein
VKRRDDQQAEFVFPPPQLMQQGDGSTLILPAAKPLAWLTPKDFAKQFNVTRSTVYRWMDDGTISENEIKARGKRKVRIAAAAVPRLERHFLARHHNYLVA